jgi:hypothetical protein
MSHRCAQRKVRQSNVCQLPSRVGRLGGRHDQIGLDLRWRSNLTLVRSCPCRLCTLQLLKTPLGCLNLDSVAKHANMGFSETCIIQRRNTFKVCPKEGLLLGDSSHSRMNPHIARS